MDAGRVAKNNATFRLASERIEQAASRYDVTGPLPFVCECIDPCCREILQMTMREYEEIRSSPIRFVTAPGHEVMAASLVEVVERKPKYMIVEKRRDLQMNPR